MSFKVHSKRVAVVLFISVIVLVLPKILYRLYNDGVSVRGSSLIEFELEHCNCFRKILVEKNDATKNQGILYSDTTCSSDAYLRGSGQKVISYTFYGDINTPKSKKKGYFEGIVENLKLMPIYYPGWIMRVYYDLDDKDPIKQELCDLSCRSSILDLCNTRHLPGTPKVDASNIFPPVWRFFPTLDKQVDIILSRDLDSRFSAREVAAVDEWRKTSNHSIHSMRDHPSHHAPLLAGAWGADLTRYITDTSGNKITSRQAWKTSWNQMLQDKEIYADRHQYFPDQNLIARYVWRQWGQRNAFQHDSYGCSIFKNAIGFPTKRPMEPNNFVASVTKKNQTLAVKCPVKCRRNLEWEYC